MRKRIIAGNWKMNKTVGAAKQLVQELSEKLVNSPDKEVVICPPFTALYPLVEMTNGTGIAVGAQNMYCEESGAFTGEVAPEMIKEVGCKYVILGHSERRQIFNESDELINKKIAKAFEHNLVPILCVGESLEIREANTEVSFVEKQLEAGLNGFTNEQVASMVIAYEPIWAIGTGKTATSMQAEEMCKAIREKVASLYDEQTAQAIHIQYGGSVKGSNAADILNQENIDGALVGGASLKAEDFLAIIEA